MRNSIKERILLAFVMIILLIAAIYGYQQKSEQNTKKLAAYKYDANSIKKYRLSVEILKIRKTGKEK